MAKAKVTADEAEATLAELPNELTPSQMMQAKMSGNLNGNVMLYRSAYIYLPLEARKRKMAECTCSACGAVIYNEQVNYEMGCGYCRPIAPIGFVDFQTGESIKSGKTTICPECGEGLTALHIGSFRHYYTITTHQFLTIHSLRGHLCFLSWVINKDVHKDATVTYSFARYEGVMFIGDKKIRVTGHKRNYYSEIWLPKWEMRVNYTEEIGSWSRDEIIGFDAETVYNSEAEKSGIECYIEKAKEIYPVAYMQIWAKTPNVENIVRCGFVPMLESMISDGSGHGGYYVGSKLNPEAFYKLKEIDWKKEKPAEMLGIAKCDFPLLRNSNHDVIWLWRHFAERGLRFDAEQVKYLNGLGKTEMGNFMELVTLGCNGYIAPPVKLMNYIRGQRKSPYGNAVINYSYIRDLWKMIYSVYNEMTASLLYPKNIIETHDNLVKLQKEKESEAINRKMVELMPMREYLKFADEELNLQISPCETHAQIIKEGKMLSHCVARYAEEHASGKTTILFIRHIDKPDDSFFTLEYKNGKVIQNRGRNNCERTPEVKAFEAEWLEYIKLKEKENGKRNRKARKQSAAVGA